MIDTTQKHMNDCRASREAMRYALAAVLGAGLLLGGCTRGAEEPGLAKAVMHATPAMSASMPSQAGSAAASETAVAVPASSSTAGGVTGRPDTAMASHPVAIPAADHGSDQISAPLSFSLTATAMAQTLHLRSNPKSDSTGFLCTTASPVAAGVQSFTVNRMAEFGRSDTLFLFQWVASMDNDRGRLTARPAVMQGHKGYEVTLSGPMNLSVLLKSATIPIQLRMRDPVVLRGFSRTWPPYNTVLTMVGDKADFYHENVIADTSAMPMVVVSAAEAVIGAGPSAYFDGGPRITRTTVIDHAGTPWRQGAVGGVRLEWLPSGTAAGPAAISGYNIYRTATPADPASWRRIATVPASKTSVDDNTFDGSRPVAYIVTHNTVFPTGYEYEGNYPAPTVVKGVGR